MTNVMRVKTTLLLFCLAGMLSLAACSDEAKDAGVCPAPTATQPRAPEGDSLCASGAVCGTSGQPDHDGCPNTCSCACYEGQCYQRSCTAIACSDQPVYR
jgi:hypothetical protein